MLNSKLNDLFTIIATWELMNQATIAKEEVIISWEAGAIIIIFEKIKWSFTIIIEERNLGIKFLPFYVPAQGVVLLETSFIIKLVLIFKIKVFIALLIIIKAIIIIIANE